MIARHSIIVLIACLLTACAAHEGIYSPACMAFAGDRIELRNSRFSWEKFTDSVVVDDNGETVNQFPGYPMLGHYRVEGQTVFMETAAGKALANMYLHPVDDRLYLLTETQHETAQQRGEIDACALVLGGYTET